MKLENSKVKFHFVGVFLVSIATLLLEISLTRIFSVAQWYHFAFMVISIAFLGFGAAGTFLFIKNSLLEKDYERNLLLFSGIFSIAILGCFMLTQKIPFDPFQLAWDWQQIFYISFYYLLLGIPFFFSGVCISMILAKVPERVGKVYFFNLVGSGLGCGLVILGFSFLEGEGMIVLSSLLGFLSTLAFTLSYSKKVSIYLALGFFILLLALSNSNFLEIKISPYKSLPSLLNYPNSEILLTRWNSFSRVDVVKSSGVRYAPGLSYQYLETLPKQLGITIDGNSLDAITKFEPEKLKFLDFLPNSLAYEFKENPKVLIIEPKGGLDVLLAWYKNSSLIEVSEPNPLLVEILKNEFKAFSGNLYGNEKVRVEVEEGRSLIRRKGKYDLIVISLGGDVVKSSTGIYGLNENYLFTSEGVQDFYDHLSEDGFLVVTRWIQHPPRDGIRAVSLAEDALEKKGENAADSLVVIRSYVTLTLFLKKGKISPEEIGKIKEFAQARKFDLVYYPGISPQEVNLHHKFPEPYFYQLTQEILLGNKRKLYSEYLLDISPVSDERPYFFSYFKWDKLPELYDSMGKKWEPFLEGGFLVWAVFVQALILSLALILLPLGFLKKIEKKSRGRSFILGYFFCLGLGYMLVEISLIQKFILFLGQPVFSISITIFSLLVFSGLGSLFSEKLKVKSIGRIIPLLGSLILLYLLLLPLLFNHFLSKSFGERIFLSVLLLMPLGFLMGIPFPLGIKSMKKNRELVPWAFSVNTVASVLGSIAAIILALQLGFFWVLIFAAGIYWLGWGLFLRYGKIY